MAMEMAMHQGRRGRVRLGRGIHAAASPSWRGLVEKTEYSLAKDAS